ncbi:MAG: sulfite exporter TauE/SafE family protein [Pseudomonadota bacterium]
MTTDITTLALIGVIFLLAGGVKGVVGLGLPTVSLALLTVTMDLKQAMALMLVPSFVTNLWQGMVGGHARHLLARCWPFLVLATVCVALGAVGLHHLRTVLLTALLGFAIATYALLGLSGLKLSLTPGRERWLGPLCGVANGVLTGLTGSFVVPGVLYLQALGLSRDQLVQAMGILFTLSTLSVGLALGGGRLLTVELGLMSSAGLLPALFGMWCGQKLRHRLSEQRFRQVFFIALLIVGGYLAVKGLF